MNRVVIILLFIFASCSESNEEYTSQASLYENINYITLTNETTNGGSQIGYLKSGLKEDDVVFCFCSDLCTREIITVFELQFNRDSTNFRFKVNPTDSFTTQSSKNSCTKFN